MDVNFSLIWKERVALNAPFNHMIYSLVQKHCHRLFTFICFVPRYLSLAEGMDTAVNIDGKYNSRTLSLNILVRRLYDCAPSTCALYRILRRNLLRNVWLCFENDHIGVDWRDIIISHLILLSKDPSLCSNLLIFSRFTSRSF